MQKVHKSKTNNVKSAVDTTIKQGQLLPDEVHDRFIWKMRWPLNDIDDHGLCKTPTFSMCGSLWRLTARLIDNDGMDFLTLHLINVSNEPVCARYSFCLQNADGREMFEWSDPDGTVEFSSIKRGDNEWGCDEFISVADLENTAHKLINDNGELKVVVDVYVSGRNDINSHESLADAIGHAAEKEDLIKLANEDLHAVISKLPVRRNINAQKRQEDSIISNRTQSAGHNHK